MATVCPPKLPSGCEIWQARQPFSYLAYTSPMWFVWSISIRLYLYLSTELNSSLDVVGNGAVPRCTVDAINWSNCCLTPLCGKCESPRKRPQDEWAVMATDGKDGVEPPNHAAHGVSNERCCTAPHGTVLCCCDEEHLQRVMPGILNEKENTCKWGNRYLKSEGNIFSGPSGGWMLFPGPSLSLLKIKLKITVLKITTIKAS